jgi:ribosomal protein S18 acetylase RimI-like enzyme
VTAQSDLTVRNETVQRADLDRPEQADAVLRLLAEYAEDPMGGGQPLSAHVRENLIDQLRQRSSAHVILAYVDNVAAALLIAFEGFSTFACRPLLNIHDIIVSAPYRGRGLSHALLQAAEALALEQGCCKLTLEVLEGNTVAQASYRSFGFAGYELDPEAGRALFWEKKLDTG